MLNASPRAQLHLQRVLEQTADANGSSVSAASEYANGPVGVNSLYTSPMGKAGYPGAYRDSSARAPTPSNSNRHPSILSINRDGRSGSLVYPPRNTGHAQIYDNNSSNHNSANPENGALSANDQVYQNGGADPSAVAKNTDGVFFAAEDNGTQRDDSNPEDDEEVAIDAADAEAKVPLGSDAPVDAAAYTAEVPPLNMHTEATEPPASTVEDYLEERTPRDFGADRYAAHEETTATYAAAAHIENETAPMPHPDAILSSSADRSVELTGAPQTIYDADGKPICQLTLDEEGNPVTLVYDEEGSPVATNREDSPVAASVVRELLHQREEARRIAEERDAMRARLEAMEQTMQSGATHSWTAGGYVTTPRGGAAPGATADVDTPENSIMNRGSRFLVSLPDESAVNRGTMTPHGMGPGTPRSGAPGTPRQTTWVHNGSLAISTHGNEEEPIVFFDPNETYEALEDVDAAEAISRRRLHAAQDEAFLFLLEKADASVESQQVSTLSFAHAGEGSTPVQSGQTSNSRALVAQDQVLVAIEQEREIGELREQLVEAEEKLVKLEETNTALRLQLVLEKANRSK